MTARWIVMNNSEGFTLVELMIAISMIGILSAVAVPKFSRLIRQSQEARTRGNLHMLRAALTLYYTDRGTMPTDDLRSLVQGGYLDRIPLKYTPGYHPEGNSVSAGPIASQSDSRGDWFYVNDPSEPRYGEVMVNCFHTTLGDVTWSSL
jgi:prepilin-type N-terminal cleavage/methylation domain-containing protein